MRKAIGVEVIFTEGKRKIYMGVNHVWWGRREVMLIIDTGEAPKDLEQDCFITFNIDYVFSIRDIYEEDNHG